MIAQEECDMERPKQTHNGSTGHLVTRGIIALAMLISAMASPSLNHRATAASNGPVTPRAFFPIVMNHYPLINRYGLGYATATDRTLIRWFWSPASEPAFRVYRRAGSAPEVLVATVVSVTNPSQAINILNTTEPRYPNLYTRIISDYAALGITNIPSLLGVLRANKLGAQQLANDYYPVALVIGWGYLDTAITPGTVYTYRVEAALGSEITPLGSVSLRAGQLTPLDAPTNLTALDLGDTSAHVRPKDGDWGTAQQNRRFHQTTYLRWNIAPPTSTASINGAWVAGYDIYRAPITAPTALAQVNGVKPVQPLTVTIPLSDTPPTTTTLAYEKVSYYYADAAPAVGEWVYRVAPRDLLGQVRQWPADAAQFSAPLTARARDFYPPEPPRNVTATLTATLPLSTVVVSWDITPTADLSGFVVYRSFSISVTQQAGCADENVCWRAVFTGTASVRAWNDPDTTLERVRWYRVQAFDQDGNRSGFSAPAQAVIHDLTPPGPPTVTVHSCDAFGRPQDGYCINATSPSTDTTRYRIACRFAPGGELLPMAEITSVNNFKLESVYRPPLPLQSVSCEMRAADAHGNLSDPAPFSVPWMIPIRPPVAPTPIITSIDTALGGVNGYSARLLWDASEAGGVTGFRISREAILQPDGTAGGVDVFDVSNPAARIYTDTTIDPQTVYVYTVTALTSPGFPFNGVTASSSPRTFKAVVNGQRPITEVGWVGLTWQAGQGASLHWDSVDTPPRAWAVFRSVHRDSDYIQLTPIVMSGPVYQDAAAQHDRYWYVAVEFNPRTGEPIRYTRPRSAAYGESPMLVQTTDDDSQSPIASPLSSLLRQSQIQNPKSQTQNVATCSPVSFSPGEPLRFGEGFEVVSVTLTVSNPAGLIGFGYLRLTPPGNVIYWPVNFGSVANPVTVGDAQNHVCTGQLDVMLIPTPVQYPGGLNYQVRQISAKPWFSQPNANTGEVWIELPDTLRLAGNSGTESDWWPYLSVQLRGDLSFSMTSPLPPSMQNCAAPFFSFNLETLPASVVPLGTLTMDQYGITATESCLRYLDRYTGIPTPRASALADSNEGYLRGGYTGGSVSVEADGLRGYFTTTSLLGWTASYPFGFQLSAAGGAIGISGTRIVSGQLGGGSATIGYHTGITTASPVVLNGNFISLTLDPGGAAYGVWNTGEDVAWLQNGFRLFAGDWELYLGRLTSAGRPHLEMWATRPGDTRDVGLAQPAEIEAGLNRRLANTQLFYSNCSGPSATFNAAVNTYARRGGLSQRQKAKLLAPVPMPIHGYDASLDNMELEWLDNFVFDRNATADLRLPFPPSVTLRLVNLWFNQNTGCIDGGTVPPGQAGKTLRYWELGARFRSAEFRAQPSGWTQQGPYHDAMLWAQTAISLPHVSPPGATQPAAVNVDLSFYPNGDFYSATLLYDRADFTFDGFPFLIEGFQLNNTARWDPWVFPVFYPGGAGPIWEPAANTTAPPTNNWNQRGFVELKGALIAPYFGPLKGPAGRPRPNLFVLGWDNYVGFSDTVRAEKVWVDLNVVKLVWDYDRLVYAQHPASGRGMFAGFENYKLVPDGVIPPLPGEAQVLNLDTGVVIEPDRLGVYLGQAAGIALYRALAEQTALPLGSPPSAPTLTAWGGKLALLNVTSYTQLLNNVWSLYGARTYLDTVAVLNDYEDAPATSLPDTEQFGGGSMGQMNSWGLFFRRLRGLVEMTGSGPAAQFERFQLSLLFRWQPDGDKHPRLLAERISLEINRHGDFILIGKNIQSTMVEDFIKRMDVSFRINPILPQFEGGFTGYELLSKANPRIDLLTVVVGVGAEVNYIGGEFEGVADTNPGGSKIRLGGSLLVGVIKPNSPVLQTHFKDLMSKLSEIPGSGNQTFTGFYLRAHGQVPVYGVNCLLQVTVGAEVAGWYWSIDNGQGDAWGGKLRGYAFGSFICLVSIRGDITLQYWQQTFSGQTVRKFEGTGWVAGGLGFCDADGWKSWETRWWDQPFCWTAGAYLQIRYDEGTANDGWKVSYSVELE